MNEIIDPDTSLKIYVLPEDFEPGKQDLSQDMVIGTLFTQVSLKGPQRTYGNHYVLRCTPENTEQVIGRASFAPWLKERKKVAIFMMNDDLAMYGYLVATPMMGEQATTFGAYDVHNIMLFTEHEKEEAENAAKRAAPPTIQPGTGQPVIKEPAATVAEETDDRKKALKLSSLTKLKAMAFDMKIQIPADISKDDLIDRIIEVEKEDAVKAS